jgi:acetyl esterase/lipase
MKNKFFFFLLLLIVSVSTVHAQQKIIQLYNGAAPGSENWNWDEKFEDSSKNMFRTNIVYDVSKPTLTVFSPDPSAANGTAIIICPGGGFHFLSINSEGIDVANWLVKKGVTCFVLKYRVVHSLTSNPAQEMMNMINNKETEEQKRNVIMMAISDGRNAIAYVRQHAIEYKISPDEIGIIGFSAGGTIAASSAFNYTADNKPNFVAPIYAFMPDSLQGNVASDAPPMFLGCRK